MHPHPRHRRGRQDPAPRHVLPDERQLLVRRLLQGGAIAYAWELLTSSEADGGYGFDPKDLWVTVYKDDDEAIEIWKRIAGLPDERIQRLDKDTNYWSTGQPGPAGPCSEIFFDRGPAYGADGGPATDDDRYVEIWNLVFMQYLRRRRAGKYDFEIVGELPKKNIDTGMGLERVAFLKQGVENMYEIDQVRPVLDRAAELSGAATAPTTTTTCGMRVIADHVRSLADAHVRRRRAVERGPRLHPAPPACAARCAPCACSASTTPTFAELFPASRDAMKAAYPEVEHDFARIAQLANAEEETFLRTLAAGTSILDLAVSKTKSRARSELAGDTAFLLHDTYGFPIDLTLEMAEEAGLTVDRAAFDTLMAEQRTRAKADARAEEDARSPTCPSTARSARSARPSSPATPSCRPSRAILGLIVDGASVHEGHRGPDRRGHPRRDVALRRVRRSGGRRRH